MIIFFISNIAKKQNKEVKKEKKLPLYVVPTSNFMSENGNDVFLSGIPCRVASTAPYKQKRTDWGVTKEEDVIDVVSLATGIMYTIPVGWYKEFNSRDEAIEAGLIENIIPNPLSFDLVGKKYYPKDNSYIADFNGKWGNLIDKEVEIISLPFKDTVEIVGKKYTKNFVLVNYQGKVYRTLFEEWSLYQGRPHLK